MNCDWHQKTVREMKIWRILLNFNDLQEELHIWGPMMVVNRRRHLFGYFFVMDCVNGSLFWTFFSTWMWHVVVGRCAWYLYCQPIEIWQQYHSLLQSHDILPRFYLWISIGGYTSDINWTYHMCLLAGYHKQLWRWRSIDYWLAITASYRQLS